MLAITPIPLCTLVASPLYVDAVNFLGRMQTEKKINVTNIELFSLLYGEDCYKLLLAQGYFNNESN